MSVEHYETHFPPLLPPDEVFETARHLLEKCPVTHSDVDGGFWVVNRHDDVLRVLQDWRTFPVGRSHSEGTVRIPFDPPGIDRPRQLPIDANPPLHRRLREILNPYLSPQAVQRYLPGFRAVASDLIDGFVHHGRCDFAAEFAKVFPAQITFRELFGIDDGDELTTARTLIRHLTYDLYRADPKVLRGYQFDLDAWTLGLVEERRRKATDDDLLDALVHRMDADASLSERDLVGAIQLVIKGGFSTTADASCNLVLAMADDPGLEDRLRDDPGLIEAFIEEVLRIDPPITGRARRCETDVAIGDETLHAGDRVLVNIVAANHDPAEFEHPDVLDLHRERNRHLTFSAGVHRCVGSSMARASLAVVVEELLARVRNIRLAPRQRETRVSFTVGVWRAVDTLPIVFDAVG